MAKSIYIERLTRAIEQAHRCRAEWIATGPVKQVQEGRTIWEGDVETFALIGHPKARRAFAWAQPKGRQSKDERVVTVLEIPPVNSAEKAVKTILAGDASKAKRD